MRKNRGLAGKDIGYRLERSHDTVAGQVVRIEVPDTAVAGDMQWRRFPSSEPYRVADQLGHGAGIGAGS